ncbi:hypothetical protein GJAV_G00112890 [Gymnothorax javanicus]|nr:hypothetical protein GJAV_G00112890 [Gymnothorax javanicus]
MMPRHGSSTPQTTMPPFTISTSKSTYSPGDTLMVTLKATSSSQFEGFMLQARVGGSTDPVGSFPSFNSSIARTLDCNNSPNSTISHRSANNLRTLEATWEAPSNSTPGDIMFCATFVKEFNEFWVNVNSPAVRMSSSTLNIPPSNFILLAVAGLLLKYN